MSKCHLCGCEVGTSASNYCCTCNKKIQQAQQPNYIFELEQLRTERDELLRRCDDYERQSFIRGAWASSWMGKCGHIWHPEKHGQKYEPGIECPLCTAITRSESAEQQIAYLQQKYNIVMSGRRKATLRWLDKLDERDKEFAAFKQESIMQGCFWEDAIAAMDARIAVLEKLLFEINKCAAQQALAPQPAGDTKENNTNGDLWDCMSFPTGNPQCDDDPADCKTKGGK